MFVYYKMFTSALATSSLSLSLSLSHLLKILLQIDITNARLVNR